MGDRGVQGGDEERTPGRRPAVPPWRSGRSAKRGGRSGWWRS